MIAAFLLAALALDLALVFLATSDNGFSRVAGPFHIRLHDPHALLIVAALVSGGLVAVCWNTRARAWALAVVVAAVAAGTLALTRSAETMFPIGDIAVIELYVRNALSGRLLVGPYSRFGWHHPGPGYLYLLAPFYALAGKTTASLAAGSAAIAIAAFALLAWTLARSFRPRAAVVVLFATLVYLLRVPDLTASAWNPHIVVLPMLALIVASSGAAGGDTPLLPIVVTLASLIMQADVALVPAAAAMTVAAVAGLVAIHWRRDKWVALEALNLSAWIAAALWLLPLSEELTHTPGNATLLWRFFAGSRTPGQSFAVAFGAWATMLSAPVAGALSLATGGAFNGNGATVSVAIGAAQVAALCAVAVLYRKSEKGLARLAVFTLLATLVALWSVTRIEDRIMDHEVFWISAVGALGTGVVLAAAIAWLARFVAFRPAAIAHFQPVAVAYGAAIAVVAAICFFQGERAEAGRLPVTPTNPVVERLAGSLRQYLEGQGAHKPLIRIGEDVWGLAAGVLLQTDRGGIPFAVEESWMPMFPQSFAANGEEDSVVAFGNTDEHVARTHVPGSVFITSFSNTYMDGLPYSGR